MNKIKLPRKSVALFCAVLIAAFSGGALFSANAGVSKISVVSDTAIRNGIATNVWINEGNVKGENGKVLFDESVGENGRIVVMTKIKDVFQSGFSKNLDASFTFCIDDIPDGARFAVAFGLPKVLSALGTAGSSEVYFVRQNGRLAAGVAVYGDEGAAEIAVPKAVSGLSFGTEFTLAVVLQDEHLIATVTPRGGSQTTLSGVSTAGNTVSAEGYVAIGQVGRCKATLSSVRVDAWEYRNAETPAATDSFEDFTGNAYNQNVWYSRASGTSETGGVFVENEALVFRGLGNGFFGTRYRYSNFELKFDLVHLQRKTGLDENGKLQYAKENGSWFGVSFGQPEYNEKGFNTNTDGMFTFSADGVARAYRQGSVVSSKSLSDEGLINFWDEACEGKVFCFKAEVSNGVFRLSYRMEGTSAYVEVLRLESDSTPYGYVRILAVGSSNMIFDNVEIVNRDAGKSEIDVDYQANVLDGSEHWEYFDSWSDDDLIPWAKR